MSLNCAGAKNALREMRYGFSGTKRAIFENAIELFLKDGFDRVSVKNIAEATGIRQSAIYNHFASKDEILEAIYDNYAYFSLVDRPHLDELEPVLKDGSISEIIESILYQRKPEHQEFMAKIIKIMSQQSYIDERARRLVKKQSIDEGIEFAKAVMDRAVEIGRLAPFDTYAMSLFLSSVRHFVLHCSLMEPSAEIMARLHAAEAALYRYAADFLVDLRES